MADLKTKRPKQQVQREIDEGLEAVADAAAVAAAQPALDAEWEDHFFEFLKENSRVVASWPKWQREAFTVEEA